MVLTIFFLVFQCNLGTAGDLSIWEFSGQENYYMLYDHFIGNTNCIHTIVFNLEDSPQVQLQQIKFWLNFLQSRIPPVEPLGKKCGSILFWQCFYFYDIFVICYFFNIEVVN